MGRSPKYLNILDPLEKPEDLGTLGSRSCRQHHLELWELPHSEHRGSQELSGSPYPPPPLSVIPPVPKAEHKGSLALFIFSSLACFTH